MYVDPNGNIAISTAILIGAAVGAIIGSAVGGTIAYNIAKKNGKEGRELLGSTAIGVVTGSVVGATIGAVIGYGVGYLTGATCASGLAIKSVGQGVKTFLSQTNKVNHVLGKTGHNLTGYTVKSMGKLMKQTLMKGVVSPYKSVRSAYWIIKGSEVTFTIINGVIKISDMWIR